MTETSVLEVRVSSDGEHVINVGPRPGRDVADLLREALHAVRLRRAGMSNGPSRKLRFDCTGRFVDAPLSLRLEAGEVEAFAQANAVIHVRLRRDSAAYEQLLRTRHPPDEIEDYLTQPDAVPKLEVLLTLRGSQLSFDEVSRRLGRKPTKVWRATRPFTSDGSPRGDQWILSTGVVRGFDFGGPLNDLLAQVQPLTREITSLSGELGLDASIDLLAIEYGDELPVLVLEPQHLSAIRSLNAALWLDVL